MGEETDEKLNKMALQFNQALDSVRKQLAKDRKHAETQLKSQTAGVWAALEKNREMQEKKNAEMAAATRRQELDAMEEANKLELKHAIRKAIETGEKRAKEVEANGEKMDKDTKWLVNNKLSAEISKLRAETDSSVEALNNLSTEAREEMRKEMIFAIRSAAEVAKTDLDLAVRDGVKKMIAFEAKAASQHADSAAARAALKSEIADNAKQVSRMIKDAVDTDARAQTALGQAVAAKLKKTNTQIDAVSAQMKAIAKKNRADIESLNKKTLAKIAKEQEHAKAAVKKFASDDAARQKAAMDFMTE